MADIHVVVRVSKVKRDNIGDILSSSMTKILLVAVLINVIAQVSLYRSSHTLPRDLCGVIKKNITFINNSVIH